MDIEVTSSDLFLPGHQPIDVINQTSVSVGEIAADPKVREFAAQIGQWVEKSRQFNNPPGMMNRTTYMEPKTPYDEMRAARWAVRTDDVVSGLADATESIAFDGGLKWESSNADDADVFNQLSADLNLDGKIREMWREIFTVDQFVAAKLWDYKEYVARGVTEKGNKKKKRYRVWVPTRLVMLKPENTVPIGWGPLREDDLAWQATDSEIGSYNQSLSGAIAGSDAIDPLMRAFFTGVYQPGIDEAGELTRWGVNLSRLLAMRSDWVFRHTSTKPDWAKFPDIRLRGIFEILDLKRQLISSDRAMLVGAANYILLIKKGSKEQPATSEEVTNLKAGYQFLAKLPVIISDHRLDIEIIAPKLDFVLKADAYDTLDKRILAQVLSTFTSTGRVNAQGADTFSDVLVAWVGSQRHMIKRTLEQEISRAIVEHPKNAGIFENRPSLVFTPRNVALGTNQNILNALLSLRTQREISRDTILEYLGLDEATEAQRLQIEKIAYDDIFQTQIPFSSPATQPAAAAPAKPTGPNGTPEDPAASGRRGGGRPTGGGTSTQSPQAQTKPRSANGNVQPGKA